MDATNSAGETVLTDGCFRKAMTILWGRVSRRRNSRRESALFFALAHQGLHLERKAEEVDETLGVLLVVDVLFLERRELLPVEGVRRLAAPGLQVAFVHLH